VLVAQNAKSVAQPVAQSKECFFQDRASPNRPPAHPRAISSHPESFAKRREFGRRQTASCDVVVFLIRLRQGRITGFQAKNAEVYGTATALRVASMTQEKLQKRNCVCSSHFH